MKNNMIQTMLPKPAISGHNRMLFLRNIPAVMLFVTASFFMYSPVIKADGSQLQILVENCAEIIDDKERLSCFDNLTKTSVITQPSPAILKTSDLKKASPAKKDQPQLGNKYLVNPSDKAPAKTVTLSLADAYQDKRKRWVFVFENRQVWRQLEGRYMSVPRQFPVEVKIIEGAFGSHDLRIGEKGRKTKVKRLE